MPTEAEADTDSLFALQEDTSDRIKNALSNIRKTPKDRRTKEHLESRLEILEQLWSEFLSGHKDVMLNIPRKKLKQAPYMTEEVYNKTEENYLEAKCIVKEWLNALVVVIDKPADKPVGQTSKLTEVKLPDIQIPKFSGKYSEWNTFRDLFVSLVHNRKDIDSAIKLHLLKGYVTGEAEQLLRQIPVADANYDRSWKLLEQRYNNKRFVSHHILKRLFSQRTLTAESANGLKDLLDTTNDCLSGLHNIGVDVTTWDIVIIHFLTLKLDPESRRQWEFNVTSNSASDELPTYDQFKGFLTSRYRALEFLPSDTGSKNKPTFQPNNGPVNRVKSLHAAQVQCPFCSEQHNLGQCKKFNKESVESRRNFVLGNSVCFICLGSNHSAKYCHSNLRCRNCKGKHHTLLHPKGSVGKVTNEKLDVSNEKVGSGAAAPEEPVVSCVSTRKVLNEVLLATALVKARLKNGDSFMIRALLDQGSQSSFVTESTAQSLGLERTPVNTQVLGVGGEGILISKAMVTIEITSRVDPKVVINVKAYVLKSITSLLPARKIELMEWKELTELMLADPEFHTPSRIDLLLGAEVYSQIIQDGVRKGPLGSPVAQSTSLGWVISGVVNRATKPPDDAVKVMHCQVDGNDLLKRFWELEADAELPKEKILNKEDRYCEEFFSKTTQRDLDGRYIVRLPFKSEHPEVIDSMKIAERRFKTLERKLNNNPDLKKKYTEVIKEYLSLGHMELVPKEEMDKPNAIYLPHHAVVREDKDTTKVRAVFDASCKGSNKMSLNDHLHVGPTLQPELRHTIMRWRGSPICLSADIIKMYRQIKVGKEDVDYQRILWRDDSMSEINHYRMLRVTFGVASAPYLAVKSLKQVALDEGHNFPMAAERVINDFYMDDLLTGCQTKEEGMKIYQEINELLGKAGLELQKWTSSNEDLIQAMKEKANKNVQEGKEHDGLKIKIDDLIKIVGLTWKRTDDTFGYTVNQPDLDEEVITKRKIISDISRFYDPLGWAAPSVIIPKILIQKLWLAGLEWDEEVPKVILNEWLGYRKELKVLESISIPRWIGTKADDLQVELHGFSDASKLAYSAVVYSRVIDSEGEIRVALISAKTKVAPVKQVSIPRLELCGAVLLTRLIMEIAAIMKIDKTHLHAWTDSSVVLAWLNSHPSRWKVFVANRVSEILTNLDSHNWSHVASKQNPADSASRGLRPSELVNNQLWFHGPEFLHAKQIDYKKPKNLGTDLEETKSCHFTAYKEKPLWDRFSSLTRMVRVIAYCKRLLSRGKRDSTKVTGHLTVSELRKALNTVIKQCQSDNFAADIEVVKKGGSLPRNSHLRPLNPYLDEDGILRVGGRLNHSQLNEDRKHPVILPKTSHLTDLIVSEAHKLTLHGGPLLMLCYLQCRYWILGAKQLVKACFRKCVTCAKNSGVTQTQLMGQLPSARVTPTRPFKSAGVDYAGPIQIRTAKGRGYKSHKGYICLFVCMVTRAIHLEVVTDLTTEGFLLAFRRFVARRGHCSDIWSDNATNFTGAASELKRLFVVEKKSMLDEVAESVATNGCTWHFIPSRSPNFGGLWEAGVKSVKYHLKRIIGQSTLTFEEMSTVLAQVEACLNSRPLSILPDSDADDLSILTPGHFLVGEPLLSPPDRNYESSNMSSLRRWQYSQKMVQHFWRRWSQEYLTKFYNRYRWSSSSQNRQPKVGDVVVVKEDGLPVCRWLYGRVVDTHPGSDNIVRVVTLKIKNGMLKRPVTKICLLPVAE